jgi:prolyl-tRNA editing enzyme YbaK/EbsC (Cys-tRNA(Pro) deacylase)
MNLNTIKTYVKENNIVAEFIEHGDINAKRSSSAVIATGHSIEDIIKVLLVKDENETMAFCILQGNRKIIWSQLETLKKPRLASIDEIKSLLSTEPGGIAPIALPTDIIKFVDINIVKRDSVIGSAGTPYVGIKLSPTVIVKQNKVIIKDIC